nr:hypothetical protein [Actinomycetota bacterium]
MRRWLAGLGVVLAVSSGLTASARADASSRSGWWNTATVSGTALPSTTAPQDLHIGRAAAESLAFAAVSFHTESYRSATLVLHVVAGSEVGTPSVLACPTRDEAWPSGGDQPIGTAPSYDCAGRAVSAVVGADSVGTTLTFLLDPSLELAPGTTSLALVPATGAFTPFALDLAAADSRSLTVVPVASRSDSSTAPGPQPSPSTAPQVPIAVQV